MGNLILPKKRQLTSSQRHLNGNKTQVKQKGLGGGINQSKGESQNLARICKTPLNANAITLTNSLLTQFHSFYQTLLYILPQFPSSDRNARVHTMAILNVKSIYLPQKLHRKKSLVRPQFRQIVNDWETSCSNFVFIFTENALHIWYSL